MISLFSIRENNEVHVYDIDRIRQEGILKGASVKNVPLKNLDKFELNERMVCYIADRRLIVRRIK